MLWPPLVERVALIVDPSRTLLVGGCVRDALRHAEIHDLDLVTHDSGLEVARVVANALGGDFYPLDTSRRTGRALISDNDNQFVIDVASLRGENLLEDLNRRDFTVNAMAVAFDSLDSLIDPLGGQDDLLSTKLIRQCQPASIADDPIRALRAVRLSLQLGLRLESNTREAVRNAAALLTSESGSLAQPERVRDEIFKTMGGVRPVSALRLLSSLGILNAIFPIERADTESLNARFAVTESAYKLLSIISHRRNDDTAADLMLGVAVMILDRYRTELQRHLNQSYASGRARSSLLLIHAFGYQALRWQDWGINLRLSNDELHVLNWLDKARQHEWASLERPTDRDIFRYYRDANEAGVDGVLLWLADFLSRRQPSPDPKAWGRALDKVAAPFIEAYFRRHAEVVAPSALLNGNEILKRFNVEPGPLIGSILDQLIEEQAAGVVKTKEQALALASRLLSDNLDRST